MGRNRSIWEGKEAWFIEWLNLPNGIPSHDTFARVFARIDPKQFEASFFQWVQSLCKTVEGVIEIDGKTLRRSHDYASGKKALHMLSALAVENVWSWLKSGLEKNRTVSQLWLREAFAGLQCQSDRSVEKGHGRLEVRNYRTISDPEILEYLDAEKSWKRLRGIEMVRAERRIDHQ